MKNLKKKLSSLGSEGIDIPEHRHIGLLSDIRGNIDEKNEIQEQINVLSRKIIDLETYKPLFLKACEEIEEEKKIILSEFSNYGYLNVIQSFLEKYYSDIKPRNRKQNKTKQKQSNHGKSR